MPETILKKSIVIGDDLEKFRKEILQLLNIDFCMIRHFSQADNDGLELPIEGVSKCPVNDVKEALISIQLYKNTIADPPEVHKLFPEIKKILGESFWNTTAVVIGVDTSMVSNFPDGVIAVDWIKTETPPPVTRNNGSAIYQFAFSRDELKHDVSSRCPVDHIPDKALHVSNCTNDDLYRYLTELAKYHFAAGISFVAIPIVFGSLHREQMHYLVILCANYNRPIVFHNDSLQKAIILSQMVGSRFVYQFEDRMANINLFLNAMQSLDPHKCDRNPEFCQSAFDNILQGRCREVKDLLNITTDEDFNEILKHCCSKCEKDSPGERPLNLAAVALLAVGCHLTCFGSLPKVISSKLNETKFGPPMTFERQQEVMRQLWKIFLALFPQKFSHTNSNLESIYIDDIGITLTFIFNPDVLFKNIANSATSHETTRRILKLVDLLKCGNLFKEGDDEFCLVGEEHARLIVKKSNSDKLILVFGS